MSFSYIYLIIFIFLSLCVDVCVYMSVHFCSINILAVLFAKYPVSVLITGVQTQQAKEGEGARNGLGTWHQAGRNEKD